ncbi:hypothetical protein SARC_05324 [Sphaeroforma arctica JP610]|uniref:Uncharacterized protein n=1 Tax=Sphaeroforma arctica JP610 TaxID=667725 RepID=A0A0L0FZV7_9EUKA|nr:hypothetical protein SARC_05324 [Sphaeroforma arctica JP610]KNC82397.1 hypothetical protein SARC_05324 [Sphaeroforma arctica JP610]|eukprot:XP_014156299.1 hypothetical protein SARC_05324 [Sphaeroforma arctica JP610]
MTHAKDTRDGGHMVGRRPLRINDLDSLEIQAEIYSHRQRDSRLSMDEREEEELFLDCRRHDTVRGVMRSVQQPISDTPLVLLRMSYDPDDRRRDQVRLGRVRNEEKNFNVEFEKTASFNAHCEKIYDFHNPKLTEEMRSVLGLDTTCDTLMVSTGRHVYSNDTCVEAIRSKQNQLLAHNFVAKAVTVLKAGGNASKCHQYLNEALSVCPKYIEALVARGAVNIQTNKLDAAIIDLQEAVNQNVEHKNAVKYLSAALVKRAKGLMDMHRSRASDKSSGMNEKALEKAMNDLQRAHKLCPDNQETFDLLKLAQHTKFEAIQQEANRKKALLKAAMSALEEEATASRERKRARRSDNDIPKTKGKRRKRSKSRSSHRKHRKGRSAKRSSSGSSGEDWDSSSTSDSSDNSDSDSDSDDASRDHGRRKKRKKRKEQHKKSRRR